MIHAFKHMNYESLRLYNSGRYEYPYLFLNLNGLVGDFINPLQKLGKQSFFFNKKNNNKLGNFKILNSKTNLKDSKRIPEDPVFSIGY